MGIALIALVVFGGIATTGWKHSMPVVPALVLCLLVAGWLFAATLVWGTGSASKVRWSAAWTSNGTAWEWSALLAVSLVGVFCLALAIRAIAHGASGHGWTLAAVSGAAFVGWSVVVRYSVGAAIFASLLGTAAVAALAQKMRIDEIVGQPPQRQTAAIPLLLAAIVIGFAWAFFALAWLVVGPEGRASCNCWADRYSDWQYQVQFLVAVIGAITLIASAVGYLTRRRGALSATSAIAAAAACGWIAFLVTGTA